MTVAELIAKLKTAKQDAEVVLHIRHAKDAAYTDELLDIEEEGDQLLIRGWVSDYNKNSFFPEF